jgi:hypothetical protein
LDQGSGFDSRGLVLGWFVVKQRFLVLSYKSLLSKCVSYKPGFTTLLLMFCDKSVEVWV